MQSRRALRLTLRQVAAELARHGEELPPSTLCRIEHGKLEPSVRRLFLLLELYRVPPIVVGDIVTRKLKVTSDEARD